MFVRFRRFNKTDLIYTYIQKWSYYPYLDYDSLVNNQEIKGDGDRKYIHKGGEKNNNMVTFSHGYNNINKRS